MNSLFNLDVDFVNFGDVKLFMPKGDNLYSLYDPKMRGASLLDHYVLMVQSGNPYPIPRERLRVTRDPRFALYSYIQMLTESGIAVDVLDVGAFVGLIGIRCANLARCFGLDVRVKLFDPSIAGQLIPYNIEVNKLQGGAIEHIPRAISPMNGPMLFSTTPGQLDSAHVVKEGEAGQTMNYLIRSISFPEYFKANPGNRHQVIKIDTEGMEPILLQQLVDLNLPGGFSAVIELTPRAFAELGVSLVKFLRELIKGFDLFEMYHFPHQSKVRPVVAENIDAFIQEISHYPHGHTDLFLMPHTLPNREQRLARFRSFGQLYPSNNLVLGQEAIEPAPLQPTILTAPSPRVPLPVACVAEENCESMAPAVSR